MRRVGAFRNGQAVIALAAVLWLVPLAGDFQETSASEAGTQQTGQHVPGLDSYDRIIGKLMREHDIPGAAVAVVRHGRLVYARGFGLADREAGVAVQPDSLFRICSLSKPVTSAAVLKLVEDGRLDLDGRVCGDLSTADSTGAWAASAIDLLRFVSAVDGRGDDDILGADTIDLMIEPPEYEDGVRWYGFGWLVRELGSGATNWWHHGSLPGSTALFVRAGNDHAWAVLMNSRPQDRRPFQRAIDKGMWKAFRQVTRWPDHDLFPQFQ